MAPSCRSKGKRWIIWRQARYYIAQHSMFLHCVEYFLNCYKLFNWAIQSTTFHNHMRFLTQIMFFNLSFLSWTHSEFCSHAWESMILWFFVNGFKAFCAVIWSVDNSDHLESIFCVINTDIREEPRNILEINRKELLFLLQKYWITLFLH